jgi:predicted Zn-dependent protease
MLAVIGVLGAGLGLGAGCSKESKVAGHIQRGAAAASAGDYLKAEIEFLNALRLEPGNLTVTRQLGEVYFQQGNISKAFLVLKRVSDAGAKDDDLRIKLARMYLTGRKLKEAREEALAVLATQPASDEAWIVYGQAAGTANEMLEANQKLEAMRPRADQSAGFHLAVGTLAFRQGQTAEAGQAYQRAIALAPKLAVAHEMNASLLFRQNQIQRAAEALKLAAELSPPRSVTPLRYADFLRDSGDEAGALKMVEGLVRQAPDYIPANVELAQMLFAAKRPAEASEAVARVLSMDPANYEAMLLGGRLTLSKGELAKGLADLEKLARVHSRIPEAHYNLAVAQLLNNDPAKALASLSQAIGLNPEYTDAILLQGDLNLRRGDATSVISSTTDLLTKRPQLSRGYILLGDAYSMRGNLAEALAAYAKSAQLAPKNPQAHYLIGSVLAQQGRRAEARKAFEQAQALAPDYGAAVEQLVGLDLAEKKFTDAATRIQVQMQRHPKSAGPFVLQSKLFLAQTNVAQAEASLRKAMETEPDGVVAPVSMAQLLMRSGRTQEGLASLRQAEARHPRDVGLLIQIGMLEFELGNRPAARATYEELLKIKPDSPIALNNLANLYAEHFNMPDQAYELARRAAELEPNDPSVNDTLGWILVKRREYRWALGLLQTSVQKLTNEPEAWYHLGVAQYMVGDDAGARASLAKATADARTYHGRDDATQRLQLLKADFNQLDAANLAKMEKYLGEHPEDPIVSGRLAARAERDGKFDQAVAILERSIAENKNNVGAIAQAARIYAERLKNPKKALELARNARDAAPENPALSHLLGTVAYANGDATYAVGLLEESSRKLPGDPQVLYDLAMAQYATGQIPESEATMQRALGLGQPFPQLETARRWLTISSLFKDTARLRQSAQSVADWLKAEPGNPAVLLASGALHELQGNTAAAEQTYTRLAALHPAFTPGQLRLALLQASRPETLPQAFETANRLRQSLPNDPDVAATLGVISYQRADYQRAAQLLAESSRARATEPQVWYYLGLARHQLKQKTEARQALERLLALEATGARATEARRVLSEIQ